MTIRLRAHHLLCMLTYVGKGYTQAFTEGYDALAVRLGAGEDIVLVAGPDDICAPLLGSDAPHCLSDSVAARDAHAALEVAQVLGRDIAPGVSLRLDAHTLAILRWHFATRGIRSACAGCEWSDLCDMIADGGFEDARVRCRA
jgi:hypothetical protein